MSGACHSPNTLRVPQATLKSDLGGPRRLAMRRSKLNKSCDQCRQRKVRCLLKKRKEPCSFSITQRRFRPKEPGGYCLDFAHDLVVTASLHLDFATPRSLGPSPAGVIGQEQLSQGLLIDRLLQNPSSSEAVLYDEFSVLKAHERRATSSGLAFFSDRKVDSLTRRIGNSKLRDLVVGIDTALRSRLLTRTDTEISQCLLVPGLRSVQVSADEAAVYIKAYFRHIHASFPFLNKDAFEQKALTAMVNHTILAEATCMALRLRYHTSAIEENQEECCRTFWVIADYDIGCPVPLAAASTVGEYDWFLSSIRFARILSTTYEALFSVSASTRPATSHFAAIDNVRTSLEKWRLLMPVEFRPQEPLRHTHLVDPKTKHIALSTHYYYHHLVIALERLSLRLGGDHGTHQEECHHRLVQAAKAVIELTRFIDVEPYTPIFILGIMPLSALFILFDFIVQNPYHADTRANLTLLDIVSGHFSQLEHVSAGALPGNHLSEFAHIARRYVQELPAPPSTMAGASQQTGNMGQTTTSPAITTPDASLGAGAAKDMAANNYETSVGEIRMEVLDNSNDFDASAYFDNFAGASDFLSDVDPNNRQSTNRENTQLTKQNEPSLDTSSSRTLSVATSSSQQTTQRQRYTPAQQHSHRSSQSQQPQIGQRASQPRQYLQAPPQSQTTVRGPQTARRRLAQPQRNTQPVYTRQVYVQPTQIQPTYVQPTYVQPTYVQPTHIRRPHAQPQSRAQPIYNRQYDSSSDDDNYSSSSDPRAQPAQEPTSSTDEWSDRPPSPPSSQYASEEMANAEAASEEDDYDEAGSDCGYGSHYSGYSDEYGNDFDSGEQYDDYDYMSDGGYGSDGGYSDGGYSDGGYSSDN
ncbi:hypothetical protein J7T55_010958 [Diaporthe amygdali]|uniref:uncharacterized protein n=1 Tax=Phomopsis amygdali TaxID=1214568 RepID=UPI0022FEEFE9|nr:uncharacterized protein J7T55_010958 [Diaporthe amygdali]KAJ0103941.1 hypothetical protein J7T55_010958 [Diaporthe amygdali]